MALAERVKEHLAALDSKTVEGRANAAYDLRHIAWDEDQPEPVVAAGCVPKLVALLGNVVEASEKKGLFGKKKVAASGKVPADDAVAAAMCLRSISSYTYEYRKKIVECGAIKPFVTLLQAVDVPSAQEHAALALANIARHQEFRTAITAAGALGPLLAMFTEQQETTSRVRAMHAMYQLVQDPDVRDIVAKEDTLNRIVKLQSLLDDFDSFSLSMCIANIIPTEDKERMVHVGPTMIRNMIIGLKEVLANEKNFFGIDDISLSIKRLASNNENKEIIGSSEVLKLLCKAVKTGSVAKPDEKAAVAGALWALAFSDTNKKRILDDKDCIEALRAMSENKSHPGCDNANFCLFELGVIRKEVNDKNLVPVVDPNGSAVPPLGHVMLSYNWKHQSLVLRVKNALQAAGYVVWIDVEQMSGNTLEAMAKAVEDSAVVLVCASRLYLESPNCRSEANYAFAQRKDIVPLVMEKNFTPQGWLGLLFGTKLYYDFSGADFDNRMQALIRELGHRGQANAAQAAVDMHIKQQQQQQQGRPQTTASSNGSATAGLSAWSVQDTSKWLTETAAVPTAQLSAFEGFDGLALKELVYLAENSPQVLYEGLLADFGFRSRVQQLQFVGRLRTLAPSV